jgi:hypothetical protein
VDAVVCVSTVLSVRGGGELTTGAVGVGSSGRVRVPGRLKFWSSRGPTASVAGVLLAAGSVVFCASAGAAGKTSPNASNIVVKRNPALIFPLCAWTPSSTRQRAPSMPAATYLFKHRPDERWRNLAGSTL